jgi:hypothetical protein
MKIYKIDAVRTSIAIYSLSRRSTADMMYPDHDIESRCTFTYTLINYVINYKCKCNMEVYKNIRKHSKTHTKSTKKCTCNKQKTKIATQNDMKIEYSHDTNLLVKRN